VIASIQSVLKRSIFNKQEGAVIPLLTFPCHTESVDSVPFISPPANKMLCIWKLQSASFDAEMLAGKPIVT
jgi:hypothetical protein